MQISRVGQLAASLHETQNKECASIVGKRTGNCEEARLVCSAASCVVGPPPHTNQQASLGTLFSLLGGLSCSVFYSVEVAVVGCLLSLPQLF